MLPPEVFSEFRSSLHAGHYNLLLGSGVSLDSMDSKGEKLISAAALAEVLCGLKKAKAGTSLARVANALTKEEVKEHLTDRYKKSSPGKTVGLITNFVWRQIFTFNIDDALEAAYAKNKHSRQKNEPLNYHENYRTTLNKGTVYSVHLHGFVGDSEAGYVFSTSDYARVTRGLNPWMHVLSELLSSEPFIISGTSLNESDLDFYLSGRNESSPRANRGPSILVEPFPDALTQSDCERYGLILVKSTMSEFLEWVVKEFGSSPTVDELVVPQNDNIFRPALTRIERISFFSSLKIIRAVSREANPERSAFLYGQPPGWSDLESSLDVLGSNDARLIEDLDNFFNSSASGLRILCAVGGAGSGKTTAIKRSAYDYVKRGMLVLWLGGRSSANIDIILKGLSSIDVPYVLVVDNLADHIALVRSVFHKIKMRNKVVILSGERSYRRQYMDRSISDLPIKFINIKDWSKNEHLRLIERYRQFGLVGDPAVVRSPQRFSIKLVGDSVAVATCRIMNDFKPLDGIIASLVGESNNNDVMSYAIAALSEYCYSAGVQYPILNRAWDNPRLEDQIAYDCALPLASCLLPIPWMTMTTSCHFILLSVSRS